MIHTFTDCGQAPSELQRGLSRIDRDHVASLAELGANEPMLARVRGFMRDRDFACGIRS